MPKASRILTKIPSVPRRDIVTSGGCVTNDCSCESLGLQVRGWMGFHELVWLFTMAQRMSSVIEIGCWKGRSTTALSSGCPGPVFAVDHWLGSRGERALFHSEAVENDVYA